MIIVSIFKKIASFVLPIILTQNVVKAIPHTEWFISARNTYLSRPAVHRILSTGEEFTILGQTEKLFNDMKEIQANIFAQLPQHAIKSLGKINFEPSLFILNEYLGQYISGEQTFKNWKKDPNLILDINGSGLLSHCLISNDIARILTCLGLGLIYSSEDFVANTRNKTLEEFLYVAISTTKNDLLAIGASFPIGQHKRIYINASFGRFVSTPSNKIFCTNLFIAYIFDIFCQLVKSHYNVNIITP